MRKLLFLAASVLPLSLFAEKTPLVVATSPSMAWIASRLCGADAVVTNPVNPAVSPREWIPLDADIALMERADLVVANGGGTESWLPTGRSESKWFLFAESALTRFRIQPGETIPPPENALALWGPHVVLDPLMLAAGADALAEHLAKVPGMDRAALRDRLEALRKEAMAAHRSGLTPASMHQGPKLIQDSRLAWLARRYGWDAATVWDEGGTPADAEGKMAGVRAKFFDHISTVLLWADPPDKRTERTLRSELGLWQVPFRTGEDGGGPLQAIRHNLALLAEGYTDAKP
jgi:ABC-type Zn uptake system ZnuABC Zn-binding protein ZnuA